MSQAGERPVVDPLRQYQPPPQVAQVVDDHTDPELHFVRPKSMAAQPQGKEGGRPASFDGNAISRLRRLLKAGKSQAECATILGVSVRTIGRVVAGMKV